MSKSGLGNLMLSLGEIPPGHWEETAEGEAEEEPNQENDPQAEFRDNLYPGGGKSTDAGTRAKSVADLYTHHKMEKNPKDEHSIGRACIDNTSIILA